jgi:hypothetical protein
MFITVVKWVGVALAGWCALSVMAAFAAGRFIRAARRDAPKPMPPDVSRELADIFDRIERQARIGAERDRASYYAKFPEYTSVNAESAAEVADLEAQWLLSFHPSHRPPDA